jgi:hypothetical protein
VIKEVEAALGSDQVLWLTDRKGRRVGVPGSAHCLRRIRDPTERPHRGLRRGLATRDRLSPAPLAPRGVVGGSPDRPDRPVLRRGRSARSHRDWPSPSILTASSTFASTVGPFWLRLGTTSQRAPLDGGVLGTFTRAIHSRSTSRWPSWRRIRGLAGQDRSRGRLLPRPDGRRRRCWRSTPLTYSLVRCTGSAPGSSTMLITRSDMHQWTVRDVDQCWAEYTRALEELCGARRRRARAPRPHQGRRVPRAAPRARLLGRHGRIGRSRWTCRWSVRRPGWKNPPPSSTRPEGFLDRLVAKGVTFTTASDAHSLERVGSSAPATSPTMLEARGVHQLASYTKRQRQMMALRAQLVATLAELADDFTSLSTNPRSTTCCASSRRGRSWRTCRSPTCC